MPQQPSASPRRKPGSLATVPVPRDIGYISEYHSGRASHSPPEEVIRRPGDQDRLHVAALGEPSPHVRGQHRGRALEDGRRNVSERFGGSREIPMDRQRVKVVSVTLE